MAKTIPDDCEFHIFSCQRCMRQWTVHCPNEPLECFFYGLCYWCIRELDLRDHQVFNALAPLWATKEVKA